MRIRTQIHTGTTPGEDKACFSALASHRVHGPVFVDACQLRRRLASLAEALVSHDRAIARSAREREGLSKTRSRAASRNCERASQVFDEAAGPEGAHAAVDVLLRQLGGGTEDGDGAHEHLALSVERWSVDDLDGILDGSLLRLLQSSIDELASVRQSHAGVQYLKRLPPPEVHESAGGP